MRRLVIDASVAVKWLVSEDGSDLAVALRAETELLAPDLLLAECSNALWKLARRGELDAEDAELGVRLLERVEIDFRPMRPLIGPAVELARTLNHPVYDCLYLALAHAEQCACVTADERFLAKAKALPNVQLLSLAQAAAL